MPNELAADSDDKKRINPAEGRAVKNIKSRRHQTAMSRINPISRTGRKGRGVPEAQGIAGGMGLLSVSSPTGEQPFRSHINCSYFLTAKLSYTVDRILTQGLYLKIR